jgi:hypothetical protein
MREIWIPELISSLMIFFFLIRPLIKGLWPLDGIAWFPLLAFGILLASFPAYGFRPECIPLLINHGVFALASLGSLFKEARPKNAFRGRIIPLILLKIVILGALTTITLFFAPLIPIEYKNETRTVNIRNEARGQDYTLYVYEAPSSSTEGAAQGSPRKPLLFLIPPDTGSAGAVDRLCTTLMDRGFSVLSYQRRGFDFLGKVYAWWQSHNWGTAFKSANNAGRTLEEKRREEIEFLLPYIRQNNLFLIPTADPDSTILVGLDAGGAALIYLADSAADVSYANGRQGGIIGNGVRGIVAVESRFWSIWNEEERQAAPVSRETNWFLRGKAGLLNWLAGLSPIKITGLGGPLPKPRLPILYLASDQAFGSKSTEQDYAAVFAVLGSSANPAAIAAFDGAGPLDYTDYPVDYPLYSSLFPGDRRIGLQSEDFTGKTADLIANFTALLLENTGVALPKPVYNQRERGLRIETWSWNLPHLGYILSP